MINQTRHWLIYKELDMLEGSLGKLQEAQGLFVQNISTLTTLKNASAKQEALVPMTSSVYVIGQLENRETVLVDIGTGYFVEKVWINADTWASPLTMIIHCRFRV